MNEKRPGRRRGPLPDNLPPARRRFLLELRRHVEESGITMRTLAQATNLPTSRISEILNGRILVRNEDQLQSLITALGLDDSQRAQLVFLHRQAVDEEAAARLTGPVAAATELADCLAELRRKSGLSLREISVRLALMDLSVSKSTVERTFDDPDRSPVLALQVALVLLDVLPGEERGPAAERLFRAVLGSAAPAAPGHVVVRAAMGSGKTHSALAALQASRTVPSEETVASLARILDLPVQELLALRETASGERGRPTGRPISEWSPLELEVHPPAPPTDHRHSAITELPPYIERPHDRLLAATVREAADGQSQMVVVTGSSSTGKTRSCWEAVQPLAESGWRLWHPFNPTRPDALLEGIDRVAPRTVVWLNEAQHYLLPADLGERVARALRRLLSQPERGPILILGTIWPAYLDLLTAPPASGAPDPHGQARALLTGRTIFIPDTFDAAALRSAEAYALSDPRLAEAVAQSGVDGKLTQHLAGAPQLLHRYEMATPTARAILEAAMDARRLGVSITLPQTFLTDAAIGYLTNTERAMATEDWAEQAFAELARPVAGSRGPLRRIRPRPAARPAAAPVPRAPVGPTGAAFRLADYLDVYGRETRRFLCPPDSFWHAGYTHLTSPEDLNALADAASDRYRLQWAHHLRQRAAEVIDDEGLVRLARLREEAGDHEGAERLARAAVDAGYTSALRELARMRQEAGDRDGAQALAQQAASHGDALALAELAWTWEEEGDRAGAERLARQAAEVGDTYALRELARMRETAGDSATAEILYRSAADIGDGRALLRLAEMREEAGDRAGAERLARQAAEVGHVLVEAAPVVAPTGPHDDVETLCRSAAGASESRDAFRLAEIREVSGDLYEAERLAQVAADAGDLFALNALVRLREQAGDREGAERLALRAIDAGNPLALAALARMRENAGDLVSADMLYLKTANVGMAWLVNPARRWPYGLDPDGAPTPPWQ